ncbi:phosphatase PAP2 family protein [Kribbella sp. NPDC048915]|uniref:phosphatase PAP2 family protein n=1 Tax=Kribbella sp. NPDC048915 TaxID=3155148 RepID=UPI0033E4137E
MNSGSRGRFLVGTMVLGLLLLVMPAVAVAGDARPVRFDRWVQSGVDASAAPWVYNLLLAVDGLGEPAGRLVLVVAAVSLCLVFRRTALALTLVVASGLVVVVSSVLKQLVGRRIHEGSLSYPSGHTAALTAVGFVLGLLVADLVEAGPLLGAAIALAGAALGGAVMAWSQIYLTAHYPTDTVGGLGTALVVVPASLLVIDRFRPRRNHT